jgi:hypothetical protein
LCLLLLAPVLLAVAEPGSSPAKAPAKPKETTCCPGGDAADRAGARGGRPSIVLIVLDVVSGAV